MHRLHSLWAVAFLLVLALPAQAATYWVSPTGTSGASGTDSLSNAKSLAWFNANAVAGDVCRFKSGTYSTDINPAHDGTANSRIRYYGFPQDPGAVTVTDVNFGYQHGSYCTAKWFTTSNGLSGSYAVSGVYTTGDSLVRIIARNSRGLNVLGKACVFDSLYLSGTITSTGQTHWINMFIPGRPSYWSTTSNIVSNCVFEPVVNTTASQGDVHILGMAHAVDNRFIHNTFNITIQSVYGYFFGVEQYEGYYNLFQNNTWNVHMNGAVGGSHGLWCHRDSSSFNRYIGNNVSITGSGGTMSFMLSNPGSFPGSTGNNCYANNVIVDESTQGGTGVFWWYDGCRRDTVQFNTLVSTSSTPLVYVYGSSLDGSVFRHNTYVTAGPTAFYAASASPTNGARSVSDIYYCKTANGSGSENIRVGSGFGLDSAGVFFSPGGSASRAISVGGSSGTPGTGGAFGASGRARWGTPAFVDSTFTSLNTAIGSSSYANSASLWDGFAGALPFAGGSSDVTPPATVTDLSLGNAAGTSLTVSWTAPGDNGLTGTAAQVDLRYSTSPITSGNFSSASQVAPLPTPLAGGSAQSYVASNLLSGTTYYFALKARDAAGNWSGLSNVATGATTGDTIPPAAIHDLGGSQ